MRYGLGTGPGRGTRAPSPPLPAPRSTEEATDREPQSAADETGGDAPPRPPAPRTCGPPLGSPGRARAQPARQYRSSSPRVPPIPRRHAPEPARPERADRRRDKRFVDVVLARPAPDHPNARLHAVAGLERPPRRSHGTWNRCAPPRVRADSRCLTHTAPV